MRGDCNGSRSNSIPAITGVRMILEVSQVSPVAFEHFHGFQSRTDISRRAEIIAMEMNWMRQLQFINDAGELGNNDGRCHLVVAGHRVEQRTGVLAVFPRLDAAGV